MKSKKNTSLDSGLCLFSFYAAVDFVRTAVRIDSEYAFLNLAVILFFSFLAALAGALALWKIQSITRGE